MEQHDFSGSVQAVTWKIPPQTKEEALERLCQSPALYRSYRKMNSSWKERFLDFCQGKKSLPLTYDPFFKYLFDPDIHGDRLSRFISSLLGFEVKILEALPGEESQIDFDLDGIPDVKMTVRSFDARLQSALIRFDREVGEAVREDPSDRPAEEPQQSAFINFQPEEQQPAESRRVEPIIVETSSVANPFSIDIVFRDRCFVRYKLDTEDDFVEGFFRTNQRLRLDGNMRIYLSLSNAGVASVKVNGTDVQLGTLGQVVSREAQWAFNHQRNLYELRIIPRY